MKRVYLVDDDRLHQHAVANLLAGWDLRVVGQAGDGMAASQDLCGGCPIDLIVTDCQMPRMDGLALTRIIRQRVDATPIIIVSGQSAPAIATTAREAGVDAYLTKPLCAHNLATTIERLLHIRIAA